MPHPSRVSRRYASALFAVAQRENSVDAVQQDLLYVAGFLKENPQVDQALAMPRIPAARKKAALKALVGPGLTQPLSQRFLDLLVDHDRENAIEQCAAAFAKLADESRNIVSVLVRTAAPLAGDQATRLKAKLDALTGHDARLEMVIDPSLVGGVEVRIGDRILDGSVKGYLEQFGARMRALPVSTFMGNAGGAAISEAPAA